MMMWLEFDLDVQFKIYIFFNLNPIHVGDINLSILLLRV